MSNATGIPALFWTVTWITISVGILWATMRLYMAKKEPQLEPYLPIAEIPELSTSSRLRV
jgi:hypothetical protein